MIPKLINWFPTCFLISLCKSDTFKSSDLEFASKRLWKQSDLQLCDVSEDFVPDRHLNIQRCYRYRVHYEWVNIEVLSNNPPILKYPGFLKPKLIRDLLAYILTLHVTRLAVDMSNETSTEDEADARVVDDALVDHDETSETIKLYNYVQHRISAFDLSRADKFLVSLLESESHAVPYFDFLQQDSDVSTKGNRMATLFLVLQAAQFGGDTIFPNKRIALRPDAGDAFVWMNMHPNHERAAGALRGECPVVWGEKISVTIFVRSKGQELRYPSSSRIKSYFGLEALIRPRHNIEDLLLYELDILLKRFLHERHDSSAESESDWEL